MSAIVNLFSCPTKVPFKNPRIAVGVWFPNTIKYSVLLLERLLLYCKSIVLSAYLFKYSWTVCLKGKGLLCRTTAYQGLLSIPLFNKHELSGIISFFLSCPTTNRGRIVPTKKCGLSNTIFKVKIKCSKYLMKTKNGVKAFYLSWISNSEVWVRIHLPSLV